MNFCSNFSSLIDYICPRLEGTKRSREIKEKWEWRKIARQDRYYIARSGSDLDQLKQQIGSIDKLLDREQSRKQSVESRLTSIVGLISIAATLVSSVLLAMAAGTLAAQNIVFACAFVAIALYMILQLFVALYSAIRGLSRMNGSAITAKDLFEAQKSAPAVRLRNEIDLKLEQLRDLRKIGDAKVSEMAVAHRAIKNFLCALLIFAVIAALAAIYKWVANSPINPNNKETQNPPARAMTLRHFAKIGPFPSGDHVLPQNFVHCLHSQLDYDFLASVGGWHIIGRVDKRALKLDRMAIYGSNQGLAMMRANWVRDQLVPKNYINNTLISIGGASNIGFNMTEPDLGSDRVVDVFVMTSSPDAVNSFLEKCLKTQQ